MLRGSQASLLLLLFALGCTENTPPEESAPPPKAKTETEPEAKSAAEREDPAPSSSPEAKGERKPPPKMGDLLGRMDNKIIEVDTSVGKPVDKSAKDEPRRRAPTAGKPVRPATRGRPPTRKRAWVQRTISNGERVGLNRYYPRGNGLLVVEFYADW